MFVAHSSTRESVLELFYIYIIRRSEKGGVVSKHAVISRVNIYGQVIYELHKK